MSNSSRRYQRHGWQVESYEDYGARLRGYGWRGLRWIAYAVALLALAVLLTLLIVPKAAAQRTTNTFNVYDFRSSVNPQTVGAMTTAAQTQCQAGTNCIIIFDPILGGYVTGTMPSRCASCTWVDYRTLGAAQISGLNAESLNNIYYVDGTHYALSDVGYNLAASDCLAAGGGKIIISRPTLTWAANGMLQNGCAVECTGAGAVITWTGGAGPASFFLGVGVVNTSVRNCYMKGPNMASTPIPVLSTSTSGGSLGAGVTVFVRTTYTNANGETQGSTEATITTGAGTTNSVTVTAPPIMAPATGYTVYSSTTTNTEKKQAASNACVAISTNCVIQSIAAGANYPVSSSAAVNVDVRCIEQDGTNNHFEENNNCNGTSYGIFETSGGQNAFINSNIFTHTTKSATVTFDKHVASKFNVYQLIGQSGLDHCNYHSGGADILSEGNSCAYVQGYCTQVYGSSAGQENEEVRVIGGGCEFPGQGGAVSRGGVVFTLSSPAAFCRKMVVQGVTFEGVSGDRVISVGECTEVAIVGNVFRNSGAATMIYIKPNFNAINNLTITANIGQTNTTSNLGIQLDASVQAISNVSMMGNVINAASSHCFGLSGAQGITNVTAIGNVGKSCAGDGFNIANTSNSVFGLNRLVATGNGITLAASSSNNSVAFNMGIGSAAGVVDSGSNNQLGCNKFSTTDSSCTFNGAVLLADGTVTAPGIAFSAETNTGIYRAGATDLRLAVNGTQLLRFLSGGVLGSAPIVSNQGTACTNGNFSLSAGWGTTAGVSAAFGFAQGCQVTITSNGTGQAANPTITYTLAQPIQSAAVLCTAQMVGGTGASTLINNTTTSLTAPVFTFGGTPVAASTYFVAFRCGP